MKKLFIVRHGETDFNRQNIVQGSGIDMPLNDLGFRQAHAFYEFYKDYPFEHVFTSTLIRSQQSVAKFIEKLPHTFLSGLNEISWGDFEGKPQTPEQKIAYFNLTESWNKGDVHARTPNGESPFELQQRQQIALNEILHNNDANDILICMHGRAMKSFLCLLLNEPLTKMENFQHRNLCLYEIHINNVETKLIRANDTTHLL